MTSIETPLSADFRDAIICLWEKQLSKCDTKKYECPHFVLLTGLPGAGKTTFAIEASLLLGVFHFDFSNFCKELFGAHPRRQSSYMQIGSVINELVDIYLGDGNTIIYDTTAINNCIRQMHFDAAKSASAKHLVWVDSDPEMCRSRLLSDRYGDCPDLSKETCRNSGDEVWTFNDFVSEFEPPNKAIIHRHPLSLFETVSKISCLLTFN